MKILVTGSSGMLGRALCQELSEKYKVIGLDIKREQSTENRVQKFIQGDITDRKKIVASIVSVKPDMVIHTAAYTDVDGCELNSDKAYEINARGTETIALACQKYGVLLCYISTDFVFDGKKESAYQESDNPNPLNNYGRSKLAGERFVQDILARFLVVRSSWLFGPGGKNFVDTIFDKMQSEEEIKVVNDQFGSPTYTKDLAQGIAKLIDLTNGINGIFHLTNSGSCSWYEFAQEIKENINAVTDVIPILSGQYSSSTSRPQMSILENKRYHENTGQVLRHWKEALKEYLKNENR